MTYQYYSSTIILRNSFSKTLTNSQEIKDAFGINFMIRDSFLLKGKKTFDLIADSSYISVFFKLPRVSQRDSHTKYKSSGHIEISQWDSTNVILKQNIDILDQSKVIKCFRGQTVYPRSFGDFKLFFD